MATDVTDDDITIVDAAYNIKLKDAISEKFIHHMTNPNTLMRTLQKYNKDVLTHEDIDYVRTLFRNTGPMAASEALLDRLYRYKDWFNCLLQAVKDDNIKLGFLEKEFQACKDELGEQILAETNEEKTNSGRHADNRITVSQREENLRLKLNIEKLKIQQNDVCKTFERQMKELQNELQILKHDSANQKEEMTRLKGDIEILEKKCKTHDISHQELKKEVIQGMQSHNELKRVFIEGKNSQDELRNILIPQINVKLEREHNSTMALDEKLESLNMEKEDLKVEANFLKEVLALPTSLRQFLHLNSDTCYVPEQWKKIHYNGLTFMLIGLTGLGKSATGNTILGRPAFKDIIGAKLHYDADTECCKYKGLNLKLVEVPCFCDPGTGNTFQRFISIICATIVQGVDFFIYVFKYDDRFTSEHQHVVRLLKKSFGWDFFRNFGVFLFTHGDDYEMDQEGESFSEYCSKLVGPVKELIDECGGAVIFDNKTDDANVKEKQIESLLYLISKKISQRRSSAFKIPSEFNIS